MKPLIISALFIVFRFSVAAQTSIDYLSYQYQYLDEDYEIVMESVAFDELLESRNVDPLSLSTYSDSLMVVLVEEFDSYKDVRAASKVLNYTWQKVSYHIWKTEEETVLLADELGADSHPWYFMQLLQDDKSKNAMVDDLIKELRVKVAKAVGEEMPVDFTNAQVLEVGFETNSARLAVVAKAKEEAAASSACKDGICGHDH